jgi:hypothetical protein
MPMRSALLIAAAAAVLLGSLGATQAAPPKSRPLGGVNLTYYCQVHYGSNYKAAVLSPGTAYDWRCVPKVHHAGTQDYGISVANACVLQYGLPRLQAYTFNPADPTSWKCYPASSAGGR